MLITRHQYAHRLLSVFLAGIFLFTGSGVSSVARAQQPASADLTLPFTKSPGAPLVKGLKLYPQAPFRFDFVVDAVPPDQTSRLLKYFLAALTVPEKDMWVNLSPYEKDRIVPEAFGQTEMGRDLLAQDYVLKQLTASLLNPDSNEGRRFWDKVYAKAREKYGTSDIPVEALNKVWIVPDKAEVFERNNAVYVTQARLKVMLDTDYAARGHLVPAGDYVSPYINGILRDVIVPVIEEEVNEGGQFAQIRQVYNALILATWLKRKMVNALPTREEVTSSHLLSSYIDHNKTAGLDASQTPEQIWQAYVEAFKNGVSSLIREEADPLSGEIIPRKYFTGGAAIGLGDRLIVNTAGNIPKIESDSAQILSVDFAPVDDVDPAQAEARGAINDSQRFEAFAAWYRRYELGLYFNHMDIQADLRAIFGQERFGFNVLESYLLLLDIFGGNISQAFKLALWSDEQILRLCVILNTISQGELDVGGLPFTLHALGGLSVQSFKLMLETLPLSFLDQPEYLLLILRQAAMDLIHSKSVKFQFLTYHYASLTASKSLMDAWGLSSKQVSVYPFQEINFQLGKKEFPGVEISRGISQDDDINRILFNVSGIEREIRLVRDHEAFQFLLTPYKYTKLRRDVQLVEKIRKQMGVAPGRKVIVVGSPGREELRQILKVYQNLYGQKPIADRPVLVLGFRENEYLLDLMLEGHKYISRQSPDDDWPDMTASNVLALNTIGELATFYAMADVAIVGQDRNLIEPAGLKVPVLIFPGEWENNVDAKERMISRQGAAYFSQDILELILNDQMAAEKMGANAERIAQDFQDEIQASADLEAYYLIGAKSEYLQSYYQNVQRLIRDTSRFRKFRLKGAGLQRDKAQTAMDRRDFLQISFESFKTWHAEYLNSRDMAKAALYLHIDPNELDDYLWAFSLFDPDLQKAYQMLFWEHQDILDLKLIYGGCIKGAKDADKLSGYAYSASAKAVQLIGSLLRALPVKLLEQPNLLLAETRSVISSVLAGDDVELGFNVYHHASVLAVQGLLEAWDLPNNKGSIIYSFELKEAEARKYFPGRYVEPILDVERNSMTQLNFTAWDAEFVSLGQSAKDINTVLTPFKYHLSRVNLGETALIRTRLNLDPGRQVIVIGSPSDRELNQFMSVYNRHYGHLPYEQRPLVIIGLRDLLQMDDVLSRPYLQGQSTALRNSIQEEWPDMSDKNVLVVNTMGELLKLYALGSIALVGHDRNLLEPASQGVPVLYFGKLWINNRDARDRMVQMEAGASFSEETFLMLMNDFKLAKAVGENGIDVVESFKHDIRLGADQIAVAIIGAQSKLLDTFVEKARDAFSKYAVLDAAQTEGNTYFGQDERYMVFKSWLREFVRNSGILTESQRAFLSDEFFGGQYPSTEVLLNYLFILKRLSGDPKRAYLMMLWPEAKINRLFEYLNSCFQGGLGVDEIDDISHDNLERVTETLTNLLKSAPESALLDPDKLLEALYNSMRFVLLSENFSSSVSVYHHASLLAAKGLIHAWDIPRERMEIYFNTEISEAEAQRHFSGHPIFEGAQGREENVSRLYFHTWNDGADIRVGYDEMDYTVLLTPYKYHFPERNDAALQEIKRQLRLSPGREVVVLGSVNDDEARHFMGLYRELYNYLPYAQRPVVVAAFRHPKSDNEVLGLPFFADQKIAVRRSVSDAWNDMSESNILVLSTLGELITVYGLADIALVSHDHNLLEPASQKVPALFWPGPWEYNKEAKDRLRKAGGAVVFLKEHFLRLINDKSWARQMAENGYQVVAGYQKDIREKADLAAFYIIGAQNKLLESFVSEVRNNFLRISAADSAQLAEGIESSPAYASFASMLHEFATNDPVKRAELQFELRRILQSDKFHDENYKYYSWAFEHLADDPQRAYKVALWPQEKMAEFYFSIQDYMRGARDADELDVHEKAENVQAVSRFLNVLIKQAPLSFLENPDRLIGVLDSETKNVLHSISKLGIALYNHATLLSARGLLKVWEFPKGKIIFRRSFEANGDLVSKYFPGYASIEQGVESGGYFGAMLAFNAGLVRDRYQQMGDTNRVIRLSLHPFKYYLPRKNDEILSKIKRELHLPVGRQVIVLGSPRIIDFRMFMSVYNNAYAQQPFGKRPLLILAFRSGSDELEAEDDLDEHALAAREDVNAPWNDMTDRNVLLLNTTGELLTAYGLGDVSLVGNDHNLLEPASQESPVLIFGERWPGNKEAHARMIREGAAEYFSRETFLRLMNDKDHARTMVAKGLRVVDGFSQDIRKRADESARFLIGAQSKLISRLEKNMIKAYKQENRVLETQTQAQVIQLVRALSSLNAQERLSAAEGLLTMPPGMVRKAMAASGVWLRKSWMARTFMRLNRQTQDDEWKRILEAIRDNHVQLKIEGNKLSLDDPAQRGGVDLNMEKVHIDSAHGGASEWEFSLDPAVLRQWEGACGITPVIMAVRPFTGLENFIGPASSVQTP